METFVIGALVVVAAVLALKIWIERSTITPHIDPQAVATELAQLGGQLKFRLPELTDRDFYSEMANDPVAAEANGWSGEEPAIVRGYFSVKGEFAKLRLRDVVAIEPSTGQRVATATMSRSPIDPDHAHSIGVHVHGDFRNRGYGREVMAAAITMMRMLPEPLHVGTHVDNIGMQRIMQQLGYTPRAQTAAYTAPNGREYEAYWYDCGSDFDPPRPLPKT